MRSAAARAMDREDDFESRVNEFYGVNVASILDDLADAQWRFERGDMDDYRHMMARVFNQLGGRARH